MNRPLRILVIADYRYPLREPLRGGLETHEWNLVRELRRRGHDVTLAAKEGSDFLENSPPALVYPELPWPLSAPRSDAHLPDEVAAHQAACLHTVMDHLAVEGRGFDVVHNHAVSTVPLTRAAEIPVPLFTTLHTPPRMDLVDVIDSAGAERIFTVSRYAQSSWANAGVATDVVTNGADATVWPLGAGGPGLCWFGRIVPEKYPHLAVDVATRIGVPLRIIGPIGDPDYFDAYVAPAIARSHGLVDYLGCLSQRETAEVVGASAATVVTPMWNEPFGQVVIESLFCGTPVVALERGAFADLYSDVDGVTLVPAARADDEVLDDLAEATRRVLTASSSGAVGTARARIRDHAVSRFSVGACAEVLLDRFTAAVAARTPDLGTVGPDREGSRLGASRLARTGGAG